MSEMETRRLVERIDEELRRQSAIVDNLPVRWANNTPTQSSVIRKAKLTAPIYHEIATPGSPNALLCDSEGTPVSPDVAITVVMDYHFGYVFADQVIEVKKQGDLYQSASGGVEYMGGTNTSTPIAQGASGSRALDNGKSVTIYARWEAIGASKQFGAWFNDFNKHWEAAAEC